MFNKLKYPKDRLNGNDGGPLRFAVFVDKEHLIIDFGKELQWIGLHKEDVQKLMDLLKIKILEL